MKQIIFSLITLVAMSASAQIADTVKVMNINKNNGQIAQFELKDIDNVSFDKIILTDKTIITPEIYNREPTESEVEYAIDILENQSAFEYIKNGAYCMRGGREGSLPSEHAYQRQYSLGPDLYAQYFVVLHTRFMYGSLTSTYDISAEFNAGPLDAYTMAKNNFIPVLTNQYIDYIPEIKAITLLYYCLAAQENADLAGPYSYGQDKLNRENVTKYNDLKTIYYDIVSSLDNIVACLKHYESERPEWYKKNIESILTEYNQTSRGILTGDNSMISYIKLANSLKLRMAMHIVKVEPETAKKWAEEAVASGVIEYIDEQMGIFPLINMVRHPLVNINNWGDFRMSASFESLLISLNHPYVSTATDESKKNMAVFSTNSNRIPNRNNPEEVLEPNTRICGIRSGTYVFEGIGQTYAENKYQAYSTINNDYFDNQMIPLYFIKFSEVDFLRAEGALRGWEMGGTAQEFYERGIRNACLAEPLMDGTQYYAGLVDDYMVQTEAVPYVSVDPIGDGEPWESVTKIGVAWNDGDNPETKLEKIITQKYIALFPLSTEAWTELRRTGYPKLFPVLNPEDGDGSLEYGDIIRRIPWVPTDSNTKEIVEKSGIPTLGGPDQQATRLWWDVDKPNF